jgi:hypothetical protein
MERYLKKLFGNSTCRSINIVDDNVSSLLDCGGALVSSNHSNHHRSHAYRRCGAHESSSPVSGQNGCRDDSDTFGAKIARGTTWNPTIASATDHRRQRWESTSHIANGATIITRANSDSAIGRPRRSPSIDEELGVGGCEPTTQVDRQGIITSHSSKFPLENQSYCIIPDHVVSGSPKMSRTMDGISRLNTKHGIKVDSIPNHSNTSANIGKIDQTPTVYSKELLWKPYLVALKSGPNEEATRRPSHSMVGPPEMPQRRSSEDSMTILAALELAVASSSPMSSSHTSLDSAQEELSARIHVAPRQRQNVPRLSPTSMSFTGLLCK